jgi:hypothetical protein
MDEEKQQPTEETVNTVEIPFPNFYSNNIIVGSMLFDFSLTFFEQLDPRNQTVKARAVMTPLQAKLLLRALTDQIRTHEDRFGPIPMPANVTVKPSDHPGRDESSTGPEPQI